MNKEEYKEVKEVMKHNKKLKAYYIKQLIKGWNEEEALQNTYDEWWYNKYKYQ